MLDSYLSIQDGAGFSTSFFELNIDADNVNQLVEAYEGTWKQHSKSGNFLVQGDNYNEVQNNCAQKVWDVVVQTDAAKQARAGQKYLEQGVPRDGSGVTPKRPTGILGGYSTNALLSHLRVLGLIDKETKRDSVPTVRDMTESREKK